MVVRGLDNNGFSTTDYIVTNWDDPARRRSGFLSEARSLLRGRLAVKLQGKIPSGKLTAKATEK